MNRYRALWPVGLLALLAGSVGCESSDDANEGAGDVIEPRPVSADQQAACVEYAKQRCARKAQCSPYNIPNFYGSLQICEAETARSCARDFALPGTTQTVELVQKCAASMPSAACARAFGTVIGDEACADPPGTLANGAACLEDSQCASDRCQLDDKSHCYRCEAGPPKTAPVGGPCDPVEGPDCAEGVCYLKQCVKLPQLNEACDASSICTAYLPCRNGVCSEALGEGSDCVSEADCVFGFDCVGGKCSPNPPSSLDVGGSCGFGVGKLCAIFTQYCAGPQGSAGTCQLQRQEGEGCGNDVFGDDTCASGLECRDGKCQLEGFSTCL